MYRKAALAALAGVLFVSLQSCAGYWGDVFEERRSVGGGFYLEHPGEADGSNYYLFEEGNSASIGDGGLVCIGWDRDFVLAKFRQHPDEWVVLDKRSGRSRVPADVLKRQQFAQKLGRFIPVEQPERAWEQAR